MTTQDKAQEQQQHEHPQPGPNVTVTVDTQTKTVHRGSWIVSEFKKEVGVSADRALDEVVGGEFKPLEDTQRITIKGDEVFVSHVRQGGSS